MKYGNIIFNGVKTSVDLSEKCLLNVGDQIQILAIDYLYHKMGIGREEIVYIEYDNLLTYDGEYVVLPINLLFSYKKYISNEGNGFSSKIIPVFIGMAITSNELSEKCLNMLRNYSPIGCRDQFSLNVMRKYGISGYLGGCISLILPEREKEPLKGKVFFVDAPRSIEAYVPEKIKEKAVSCSHLYYGNPKELCGGNLKKWAQSYIDRYAEEADLIVTSRFHAALVGIALGVPTILVLRNMMGKYTWLKNIIPVYTEEEFSEIDWEATKVDVLEIKEQMFTVAQKRIWENFNQFDIYSLSERLESNSDVGEIYANFSYEKEACDYIKQYWDKKEEKNYVIWGLGRTAHNLYKFISLNYPKAKLENVYDINSIEFHGYISKNPLEISKEKGVFCFVTSTQASFTAEEYFKLINKPKEEYFLCRDEYIRI